MNRYDEIEKRVRKEMTSNGLLLGAAIQIANMAASIQMLADRLDMLEAKPTPTNKED